jgi:hypothetical protein
VGFTGFRYAQNAPLSLRDFNNIGAFFITFSYPLFYCFFRELITPSCGLDHLLVSGCFHWSGLHVRLLADIAFPCSENSGAF